MDYTQPTSYRHQHPANAPAQQQQGTHTEDSQPQLDARQQGTEESKLKDAWRTDSSSSSKMKKTVPSHGILKDLIDAHDLTALKDALAFSSTQLLNSLNPDTGKTPLMMAVETGSIDMVKAFIECKGVDISIRSADGCTALHLACEKGDGLITDALLEAGADPDTVDNTKDTPLMAACYSGNLNVIAAIVKRIPRESLNRCDDSGKTALSWATENGNRHVVEYLLYSGADPNRMDDKGWTPCFYTATAKIPSDEKIAMLKTLAKFKANLWHELPNHDNLFSLILDTDDVDTLKYVISQKVKYNKPEDPINYAARKGLKNACYFLIQNNYPKETRDMRNYTPLMNAALNNHWEIVEMLLQAGAQSEYKESFTWTALDIATFFGFDMVAARILIHGGPIIHIIPATLKLLVQLAIKHENWEIISALQSKIIYDKESSLLHLEDHWPSEDETQKKS